MSRIRTLLVEDDEAHARLIVERLRGSSEVIVEHVAETVHEAAEIVRGKKHEIDIVLLDLGLPDSEGIDTVRTIHQASPRLPIVVLSGQRDVTIAVEAMRHGAQDYVVKSSADAANLTRTLRIAIERKRLQDVEQMLIGVVSHDLRGPLQTILLGSDALLAADHSSTVAVRIKRAAERATTLVNDLLDATRARLAGSFPIELSDVELSTLIEQIVDETRASHPNRRIELHAVPPASSRADPRRITQLLQNLLGNALQHSPPSSPVRVSLHRDAQHVEIAVHNAGTPIPAHLRDNIFEPLERGTAARDASHSIGLGLYIVSEIVRAHGGKIGVESEAGSGTTFRVRLPAVQPAT